MKWKSDTLDAFKRFKAYAEKQTDSFKLSNSVVQGATSYELWNGKKPSVGYLRV